jgi:hypothetical protein
VARAPGSKVGSIYVITWWWRSTYRGKPADARMRRGSIGIGSPSATALINNANREPRVIPAKACCEISVHIITARQAALSSSVGRTVTFRVVTRVTDMIDLQMCRCRRAQRCVAGIVCAVLVSAKPACRGLNSWRRSGRMFGCRSGDDRCPAPGRRRVAARLIAALPHQWGCCCCDMHSLVGT